MKTLNVTVMLGGFSAEREVSLESGRAVAEALAKQGYGVIELDPRDENWRLPEETDVVFIALHGTYGEDGQVQSRLEQLGVPYTGCSAAVSRLAFHKAAAKRRFQQAGLPTPEFTVIDDPDGPWPQGWLPPVVLKPVREGSSVGLEIVEKVDDWSAALRRCLQHGGEVLMENRITGREVTVGILGNRPLPIVEVRPHSGVYDYRHKYTAGVTRHLCPAPFPPEQTRAIQTCGLRAFECLGGRDYGRVDFIIAPDGSPVILEVNTLPGMTPLSLFPEAARSAGIPFPHLCRLMLEFALARRRSAGRTVNPL